MEKEKKGVRKKNKKSTAPFFFSRIFTFGKEETTLITTNKNYTFHYNMEANQNYRLGSAKNLSAVNRESIVVRGPRNNGELMCVYIST